MLVLFRTDLVLSALRYMLLYLIVKLFCTSNLNVRRYERWVMCEYLIAHWVNSNSTYIITEQHTFTVKFLCGERLRFLITTQNLWEVYIFLSYQSRYSFYSTSKPISDEMPSSCATTGWNTLQKNQLSRYMGFRKRIGVRSSSAVTELGLKSHIRKV